MSKFTSLFPWFLKIRPERKGSMQFSEADSGNLTALEKVFLVLRRELQQASQICILLGEDCGLSIFLP